MNGYTIALSLHLLFLLIATAASAIVTFGSFRICAAQSGAELEEWIGIVERVVPAFPVAVVGLLATGGYMVHDRWSWSMPWVDAAVIGLAIIVVLGTGVDRIRMRAVKRALAERGWCAHTRRLRRDPVSWTAKMSIPLLVVAVMFIMTTKPGVAGCASALGLALVLGALCAVPMWRAAEPDAVGAD